MQEERKCEQLRCECDKSVTDLDKLPVLQTRGVSGARASTLNGEPRSDDLLSIHNYQSIMGRIPPYSSYSLSFADCLCSNAFAKPLQIDGGAQMTYSDIKIVANTWRPTIGPDIVTDSDTLQPEHCCSHSIHSAATHSHSQPLTFIQTQALKRNIQCQHNKVRFDFDEVLVLMRLSIFALLCFSLIYLLLLLFPLDVQPKSPTF